MAQAENANKEIVRPSQTVNIEIRHLEDLKTLASLFVQSGMFADTKSVAQAVVKIMAGQEMGIGPFLAMDGIDIIAGKVSISPLLLAAILKSQSKYNYKVIKSTDTECHIAFFENGMLIGNTSFTIEEAKKMGLANKENYVRQPKVMLFWRCLSRGIRMYAPDLYRGINAYTVDELSPTTPIDTDNIPVLEVTPENNPEEDNIANEGDFLREPTNKSTYLSDLQIRKLITMANSKGLSKNEFVKLLADKYGEHIPAAAYNEIVEYLKSISVNEDSYQKE